MANWKYKINVVDVWKKCDAGECEVWEVADALAKQIKKLAPIISIKYYDYADELEEIGGEFEYFAECKETDADEFDCILERLYDWGDITLSIDKWPQDKLCWIATNF